MKKVMVIIACALLLITDISTGTFVVSKKKVKTPSLEECVDTLGLIEKVGATLHELGIVQQKCVNNAQAYTNKETIICLKTGQQRQEFKILVNELEDALDHITQAAKKLNNYMNAQEIKKESDAAAKKAVMQN